MGFAYFEITASGGVAYIKAQINDDDMINLLVENNKSETFEMREGWHIVNSCNAYDINDIMVSSYNDTTDLNFDVVARAVTMIGLELD